MFQLYLLLRLKNFGSQAICKQWTTDIFFIQKFQDFMPFPTKKHSMECFHHLHSFQLSAYSVYL